MLPQILQDEREWSRDPAPCRTLPLAELEVSDCKGFAGDEQSRRLYGEYGPKASVSTALWGKTNVVRDRHSPV